MCFKQLVNRSRKRALRRCGVMWERKVILFTPPDEDIAMYNAVTSSTQECRRLEGEPSFGPEGLARQGRPPRRETRRPCSRGNRH